LDVGIKYVIIGCRVCRHDKKTHTRGYLPESVPTLTGITRVDRVWVRVRVFPDVQRSDTGTGMGMDYCIRLNPDPKPVPPLENNININVHLGTSSSGRPSYQQKKARPKVHWKDTPLGPKANPMKKCKTLNTLRFGCNLELAVSLIDSFKSQ